MSEKFCSKLDYTTKREKNWKSLFLQLVFEHVDNSSDDLSVEFLPKARKCLDPIPKKLENFSKKIFFIEVFVSILRKHFSHFCKKKDFENSEKVSTKIQKWRIFFRRSCCKSKCSSERLESTSANVADYFWQKSGKKLLKFWKENFEKFSFFIKLFVWTRRMQFLQFFGHYYAKFQITFSQNPEYNKTKNKWGSLFPPNVSGSCRKRFWQYLCKNCIESWETFRPKSERIFRERFSKNIFFTKMSVWPLE